MVGRAKGNFHIGLLFSLVGHALLFYVMLFMAVPRFSSLGTPVVYSISLEGGRTLGGISQVPKPGADKLIAPPKSASPPAPKSAKKEPAAGKTEQAAVSLVEKKTPDQSKTQDKKSGDKTEEKGKKEAAPSKAPPAPDIHQQYQQAMQRYLGESSDGGGKGFGAARLGGKGMGGGVLRPPEFFQYRDLLKNHIKHGWRWYDKSAALTAWVYFKLKPDGAIDNVTLAQSSGNREYDDSVVRAVYKANPAPPPPQNVYEYFEEVRIEFEPGE